MTKDLFLLVADIQQEETLKTLLKERHQSLGIRPISFDSFRHPGKDPGVFNEAAEVLTTLQTQYQHALIFLDSEWEGSPGNAEYLQSNLIQRIEEKGWEKKRFQAIVMDPELEIWIWADSSVVPEELRTTWNEIHTIAQKKDFWKEGETKPNRPKELLESILRQQKRPRSASILKAIASRVGLKQCKDPAFLLFRETLARWFPPQS